MLNMSVSFVNISSKFVQTFCPICQQASDASCSTRDDFIGAVFNVYKWRHSDVIAEKLTAGTQN